jgi:integrase
MAMHGEDRQQRRVLVERGIYRQPNGRYAVCVIFDGKPRWRTVAETIEEARGQRLLLQAAAARGELEAFPRVTFAAVAARWLARFEAQVASGERRERTLENYRYHLESHLLPALGRRRVRAISTDDLAVLVAELRLQGLSARTVAGALVPLWGIFRFALRRGFIVDNPLRRLEPSERPHPCRREQRTLTRRELTRLLRSAPPLYRPLLATATLTGMRLSELLGLTWTDVDLAAGVIRVRRQLSWARRNSPSRRVPPKTEASVRDIPLAPQLEVLLRKHRLATPFSGEEDYVFASGAGTPLGHRNAEQRGLARAADKAGLNRVGEPRLRFHDLRHVFASHLIVDLNLDVAQVSRALGHAHISTTLDIYTHLFEAAAHAADVRERLGASDFANLLATVDPKLLRVNPPVRRRPQACRSGSRKLARPDCYLTPT